MSPRLLVVDDDTAIREALVERFAARGFDVRQADSGRAALARAREGVDVILLDLQLPEGDGFTVLDGLTAEGVEATVVVLTAYGTVERAVEAMRKGAYDFLEKPFEPARVEEVVRRALERDTLRRAARATGSAARELVYDGEPLATLVATARRAAASDASVLLLGESGTGKEVLARALHGWSARRDGPFVCVHGAALSEGLVESELFGHERGAFTGASARRTGRLEAAHGGTLFLDEVGDLPADVQVKLLRVLQERTFERVGGSTAVTVDLRVVAATHRDLEAMVRDGTFREDLYYRLNVIALIVPPLRERKRDQLLLAEHFLARAAANAGRPGLALSDAAARLVVAYPWPGNVRELRNVLERAAVLCEGDQVIAEDLPPELAAADDEPAPSGFHERVEASRKDILRAALEASGGNQTRAAEALGLQRTYLARLVRKYGL